MMRAHIDEPAPAAKVAVDAILVRGWIWLESDHTRIRAVEVWCGEKLLGETFDLQLRRDVSTALSLPESARTGFSINAVAANPCGTQSLTLAIRARFRDGTLSPFLAEVNVVPRIRPTEPLEALVDSARYDDLGLVLGDLRFTPPNLSPFYAAASVESRPDGREPDVIAHPAALPLPDALLDYLCAIKCLERLPNPIAALHEWHRVLADDGWLYICVAAGTETDSGEPGPVSVQALRRIFLESAAAVGRGSSDSPNGAEARRVAHALTHQSLLELLQVGAFISGNSAKFELTAQSESGASPSDEFALLLRKRRTGRRPTFPATFTLAHRNRAIAPLPLVCPVCLESTRAVTLPDGTRELKSLPGRRNFVFRGRIPVVQPNDTEHPLRPWGSRLRRWLDWL